MTELFLKIFNMSISAGWLVLAVVVVRLLLKKAPKWVVCLLWAMVAVRLVLPFSVESALSLIPSAETVPREIVYSESPAVYTGLQFVNSAVNPIIGETLAPGDDNSVNPMQVITNAASVIWIAGMSIMAACAAISYIKIRRKVKVSMPADGNIYVCDGINTPFILGVLNPKIYLPSSMDESNTEYVIAHERAHLRRRDHWWKPLGFVLLAVYWFNPLMWTSYVLLCRDIELACDEKVVREMGAQDKKAYSEALLGCSVPRKMIAACPLAFGEVGVKERVKSVLSYKKPAFWIIIAALAAAIVIAVCFLTDPLKTDIPDSIRVIDSGSDVEGISIEMIEADLEGEYPYIKIRWKNRTAKSCTFGEPYDIYRLENGVWVDCRVTDTMWNAIGYALSPFGSTDKKYSLYHIDMTEEGTYRLEAECSEDGKPDVDYKLWIDFELSEGTPLTTVKQYEAEELIYDSGIYSSVADVEFAPMWKVSDMSGSLYLQEKYSSNIDWVGLSDMRETELTRQNFDKRLDMVPIWSKGFSSEKLRGENKRAWEAAFTSDYSAYSLYMLLEQENGDMYICVGNYGEVDENGLSNASYRCIFRLKEVDVGSEETTDIRPSLIYKGKHYVDLSKPEAKLPDGFTYAGVITPEMANDTGLEGMKYFTNEDDEYYFYAECEVNGKLMYKMWDSSRAYAAKQKTMIYVCTNSNDFMLPTVTLYPETMQFMFSYSGFSSHIPMGTYERTDERLALREDESNEVYFFDVNGNNLYFDAENSTELPKYRYSCIDDPEYPFEDGAQFSRVYNAADAVLSDNCSGTTKADIDGDGKNEALTLGAGPTSGLFSFTITVYENGTPEYFNIFTSEFYYLSFTNDKDGNLLLRGETSGDSPTVHLFEIGVEEGNLILREDEEKLAYWGEQGVTSSWFTRYQE